MTLPAPTLPGLTASDPAFEAAWATWIRVTREASGGAHSAHKAAAREEFYRQRKRGVMPGLLELLAAIEAQGQSERWRAGVIPDFRTWLHQQRWGDDPEALKWNGNGSGKTATSGRPAGWRDQQPPEWYSEEAKQQWWLADRPYDRQMIHEHESMEYGRRIARERRDLGEE